MIVQHAVLAVIVLLTASVLAHPLARRLHLPFSAVLVAVGFVGSTLLVSAGFDTGVRAGHFHDLVFFVFLPILVFESAYRIDLTLLRRDLVLVLFLAIAVMLLSALVTAVLVYVGIGHSTGFPWLAALLTGVLLAATDPVAVVAQLRELGAPERLSLLIEGESLFNDATAIVVFTLLLGLAQSPGEAVSVPAAVAEFFKVFLGGVAVGAALGAVGVGLMRAFPVPVLQGLVSVLTAYGAFLLAEEALHVSGVVAVLVTGLALAHGARRYAQAPTCAALDYLWEFVGFVANALVFLLVGIVTFRAMFEQRWLAMLIAIGAVLAARAVSIYATVPLVSRMIGAPVSLREQTVMVWGGLRGAVTLALALSLPTSLDYWFTIQSIAFGVVLFTLFVQAPTAGMLLRSLGVGQPAGR